VKVFRANIAALHGVERVQKVLVKIWEKRRRLAESCGLGQGVDRKQGKKNFHDLSAETRKSTAPQRKEMLENHWDDRAEKSLGVETVGDGSLNGESQAGTERSAIPGYRGEVTARMTYIQKARVDKEK